MLQQRHRFERPSHLQALHARIEGLGVGYIAPPLWMLVTVEGGEFVPSACTKSAKAAGLTDHLDTWTLRPTADWRRLVLSVHQRDDEQQRRDA